MRYFSLVCLLLGALFVVAGCDTTGIAEREIERAAPRYIGPADRYDADVVGLRQTTAQQVRLTGFGVRPAPNIVLRQLVLTLNDVEYQRDPFRITRIGSALFSGQVTEQAATAYLNARLAANAQPIPLRNVQVTFLANQVRVTGTAVINGNELPVTTTGILQAQGQQVLYLPQQITVGDIALGEQLRNAIAQGINPLFDLSQLAFTPLIQQITLQPGLLTISGMADPAQLVRLMQE